MLRIDAATPSTTLIKTRTPSLFTASSLLSLTIWSPLVPLFSPAEIPSFISATTSMEATSTRVTPLMLITRPGPSPATA